MKNDSKRPTPWRLVLVASAIAAICGGAALADYVVGAGEPVVISDDVFDRTTQVISLAGPSNNGHGNNEDGVDSSNPGEGGGGPTGGADDSCPDGGVCVDDEATGGGGGASQSKKK
jgi:hypothetical protein